MSNTSKPKEILVYDMTTADEEEIREMEQNLRMLSDVVCKEAVQLIREGKFFGCYHTHLEIALSSYKSDYPCEDCDSELPDENKMH